MRQGNYRKAFTQQLLSSETSVSGIAGIYCLGRPQTIRPSHVLKKV